MPIEAGYVFDLGGGHELEVFHTPGHTPGGICLLEKKRRMLFTGDSLVRTPTLIFFGQGELCTVEAFHEHLLPLQARKGEFDALYPGHFETPQPVELLDDMVTLSGLILQEPEKYDDWQDMHGNPRPPGAATTAAPTSPLTGSTSTRRSAEGGSPDALRAPPTRPLGSASPTKKSPFEPLQSRSKGLFFMPLGS